MTDRATTALLEQFRAEHEAARREMLSPATKALLEQFREEHEAARRARGERPESIDDLERELYGNYTNDLFGQVNAVSRSVEGKVSITTLFEKGRLPGGLFHGNITAACSKQTIINNHIGLIVQASIDVEGRVEPSLKGMKSKPRVIELGLNDRPDQILAPVLDRILPEIAAARAHGINVLVNCTVGMSRSTAILLAHMMDPKGEDMTLLQAWLHIKHRRPLVLPNIGFLVQLMKYEKKIRGSSSVPIELVQRHPAAIHTIDNMNNYISALRRNLRGGTKKLRIKKRYRITKNSSPYNSRY